MCFRRGAGVSHGKVEAILRQRANTVRHIQFQADVGVGPEEFRQARHQLLPGKRNRGCHAQYAPRHACQVAHVGKAGGNLRKCAASRFHQFMARRGELRTARRALYQRNPGRLLQFGNMLAHRRLAHPESSRSLAETPLLVEHRQPVQVLPKILDAPLLHAFPRYGDISSG